MKSATRKTPRASLLTGRFLLFALVFSLVGLMTNDFARAGQTNYLTNPGAETGNFTGWTVVNGGSGWAVEGSYPHSGTWSFVSSHQWGSLSQEVDLVAKGFTTGQLDAQPTINVGTYVTGFDHGSGTNDPYQVLAELRGASHNLIASYDSGVGTANGSWTNVNHAFSGYGSGVRYVYIQLRGKDSIGWGGQYGSVFDDSYVNVTAAADTTPPVISAPGAAPAQTTASITWTTDEASSSTVSYGLTADYGLTATGGSSVTSHTVALIGLSTSTTYHYKVCSADAATNASCSDDGTFTTDLASPVAVADSYALDKGGTLSVTAGGGVRANDSGPGTLTAILVAGPAHAASFSFNADGSFSYAPAAGYVGTDPFTYKLNNGYDSNVATVTVTISSHDATTDNRLTLSRLSAGVTSSLGLSFTLHNTLSTPLTVTFPVGFTVVSPFTAATCAGGGTVDTFAMNAETRTLTAAKHNCSGTLVVSGASVINPGAPGTYIINWTNDDPGSVAVIIVGSDQIHVNAAVDPHLTFDVGAASSCSGSFISSDWSVDLGHLGTSRQVASSGDSGVKLICSRLSTNATSGAVVAVRNANGAAGLVSASASSDFIASTSGAVSSGTPRYGLCYSTVGGDFGTDAGLTPVSTAPTAISGAYGTGTCSPSASSGEEGIAALSQTATEVWRVPGVTSNAFAAMRVKVAISATQPAHQDYTDTLTFVATATF